MTLVVAIVTLAEAAGSWIGGRLTPSIRAQILLGTLGTGIAAVGFFVPAVFLPVVVTLSFLMGVAYPLRAAAIHRVAADDLRAQAASLASACDKVFVTAALLWPAVVAKANRAYIPFL
jgi:hypothetical protein